MAACYLALALGPGLPAVIGIRLVAGAAEATFVVGAYTAVMDMAPEERRGEAVSLVTLASYLGLTIGPVLSDLVRGSGRYGLVWIVTAALAFAATAVVATLRETRPVTEEPAVESWLPPRGALRPGLLVLLGLLGFGGFVAFGAIYARDLGIDRPGLIFALFGGVISLVRFFGRRLPDALGATRTLELSFICLAAGLAMIGAWQTMMGLLVGTVVFAVGQAMTYPSAVLLAVQSTSATERSAVVGSVGAAVDVALGVGALTLGAVAKFWGYGGAFLVASAVALSGLAALWPMRSAGRIRIEEAAP
jgi:predicted MFS family arabinose efflux permease